MLEWIPQGGSTAFGAAASWQSGSQPGPNDVAVFGSFAASGTITGSGTVGQLQFGGATPWLLNGADIIDTQNVLVGGSNGTLTLSNGATLDGRSSAPDAIGQPADH